VLSVSLDNGPHTALPDPSMPGEPVSGRLSRMPAKLQSIRPVLMSRDVQASLAFYRLLGFVETFRDDPAAPRYAGVRRDGIDLHLQWHDAAEWEFPADRPVYRFVVEAVDDLFEEFRASGALNANSVVRDTPWGTREFHVQDPDRNGLQFYRNL
jgi:catechol 2,3-dioxygenase-like lactoylglutathione lyase family enzyme